MNGPKTDDVPVRPDLTWVEGLAVTPLLAALVLIGVYPTPLLRPSRIPHEAAAAAMKIPFTHADWMAVLPVGAVAVAALVVLVADLFNTGRDQRYLSIGIGLAGTIVAAILAARQFGHSHDAFFGGFITGGFATVFQEIILIALAGSLVLYGANRADATRCRNDGDHALERLRRDADGRRRQSADDLSRARAALARALRALWRGRSKDRARVGAQVSDSQLDRDGILALRQRVALRCDGKRAAGRSGASVARRSIRSSGSAPECFSSASSSS